ATDRIFNGKAHRMCLICMIGAVFFISLFIFITDIPAILSILLLAMAVFFIYGPQALIGIASANHATKDASATANGLAGIFGYFGSFVSAIGIGYIADCFGWNTVFLLIIGVGVLGALTFLTMWTAPRDGYERSNHFYRQLSGKEKEEAIAEAGSLDDTDL
ncbi:MAG: MFS transporter, partial [Paramuribaculum sp.]|nr:MFS transporter [Paramuribaculum sp.]